MIPDYVLQVQEIQRNVETQSLATKDIWRDSVAKRFYQQFLNRYSETINLYINGGMGIRGMGLDEILRFFDQKQNEMTHLSGMTIFIAPDTGVKIHNEFRERVNWYEPTDGPNPGNLDAPKIKGIMNERERN